MRMTSGGWFSQRHGGNKVVEGRGTRADESGVAQRFGHRGTWVGEERSLWIGERSERRYVDSVMRIKQQ
jgi:hypothetical protein